MINILFGRRFTCIELPGIIFPFLNVFDKGDIPVPVLFVDQGLELPFATGEVVVVCACVNMEAQLAVDLPGEDP
jgi:hypothetical protein